MYIIVYDFGKSICVKSTTRKLKPRVVCDYNLSIMANKEPSTFAPNTESIRASGSASIREPS